MRPLRGDSSHDGPALDDQEVRLRGPVVQRLAPHGFGHLVPGPASAAGGLGLRRSSAAATLCAWSAADSGERVVERLGENASPATGSRTISPPNASFAVRRIADPEPPSGAHRRRDVAVHDATSVSLAGAGGLANQR